MTHEELKELLPLHALGSLDEPDASEVEAHWPGCPECRSELPGLREAVALVAHVVPPVEAPPALREWILARPTGARAPAAAKRVKAPSRLPLYTSIAMAAAIGWLLVVQRQTVHELAAVRTELDAMVSELARVTVELQETQEQARFWSSAEITTVVLVGTEMAPRAAARLAFDRVTGEAFLSAANLPPAAAGKAFQLWFIAAGTPLPGGVFQTDSRGNVLHRQLIPEYGREAELFAISVEPASGVSAPTGEVVLATLSP